MEKAETENVSNQLEGVSSTETPLIKRRGFRLSRLAAKELKETLRDRRTLVTLILMPLLVYPILSLVFRTFLLNNAPVFEPIDVIKYRFVVDGSDENEVTQVLQAVANISKQYEERRKASQQVETNKTEQGAIDEPRSVVQTAPPPIAGFLEHQWVTQIKDEGETVEDIVAAGKADAGIILNIRVLKDKRWLAKYSVVFDPEISRCARAAEYLKHEFLAFNQSVLLGQLRKNRIVAYSPLAEGDDRFVVTNSVGKSKPRLSMASLIPLILVLMTITGAVYPAIDLTAGERERGTLETLMAAPIPRMGILFSKFIAVLTVAVLTASLNILGMATTIWAFQLDSYLGEMGFTVEMCLKVFGLLVLFAAFYSAVLLAVTSYARSFKEAQSYLVPIILLSMAPGLMAMTPGLTLSGPLCVTPMVNILLLARDVLQGTVLPVPSLIAIVSTLLYTALGVLVAARIFGTDAILYGSQTSWNEMFQRPAKPQQVAPLLSTVFCLVMLFPMSFVLSGLLVRMNVDMTTRFLMMAMFTALMFFAFPWLVAMHQRVIVASGFGLRSAKLFYFVAAILLGLSLWPLVMMMTAAWHDFYSLIAGADKGDAWHDRLVEFGTETATKFRQVSPVIIAVTLSIVPAICEEWFFRGMLLRTLLKYRSTWVAILTSAVFFGLFHVLSSSTIAIDRLLPTTLIGVILGYLCYKSGSILPGIALHAIHNAIVAFLAYYQPQLSKLDWFIGEDESVPFSWVLISLAPAALGLFIIIFSRRSELNSA